MADTSHTTKASRHRLGLFPIATYFYHTSKYNTRACVHGLISPMRQLVAWEMPHVGDARMHTHTHTFRRLIRFS